VCKDSVDIFRSINKISPEISGSCPEHFKPDISFCMILAYLSVGDVFLLHLNVDKIVHNQNLLKHVFRKKNGDILLLHRTLQFILGQNNITTVI